MRRNASQLRCHWQAEVLTARQQRFGSSALQQMLTRDCRCLLQQASLGHGTMQQRQCVLRVLCCCCACPQERVFELGERLSVLAQVAQPALVPHMAEVAGQKLPYEVGPHIGTVCTCL